MADYQLHKITSGICRLEDGKMSSFYLVTGATRALLVDTGMGDEPLLPFLRTVTDLPITLLVTHGHGDHVMHAGEFDTVYMSSRDVPFLSGAFRRLGIETAIDPSGFLPVSDGIRIDLGDFIIRCADVGGHSPGSTVFYEEKRHLLFTGDALGSGAGVWMQLEGCLSLRQYRENLIRLDALWASLPEDTQVLTGHWDQRFMHSSGDNPVCRALLNDMITLCDQILAGLENRQPAPQTMVREYKPVYTASFGRASMVYTDRITE